MRHQDQCATAGSTSSDIANAGTHVPGSHRRRDQLITPHRREILELLEEYHYLRTKHFYALLAKTTVGSVQTWQRSVRRSLHLAERAGLLTHEEIHERLPNRRSGFNHSESIYYRSGDRSPASLKHDIAVTEFHLALKTALSLTGNIRLRWVQTNLRRGALNPDAAFGIQSSSGVTWFFLEVEKSRQGHYRRHENSGLVQKLQQYDSISSAEVQRDWGFDDFRVVVMVENARRAVNLVQKVATILPFRFIWIGATDVANQVGICAGIFFTPNDYARRSYSVLDV